MKTFTEDLKSLVLVNNNNRNEKRKVLFLFLLLLFVLFSNKTFAKNKSVLRGKVITTGSLQIENSTIRISSAKHNKKVSVDKEGYYYCNNLKPGNYTIVYSVNGLRIVNKLTIKENLMHKLNISVNNSLDESIANYK